MFLLCSHFSPKMFPFLQTMQLYRTDFAQVGTTNRLCMRVIPYDNSNKKARTSTDKVVVGGHNGAVICMARKNNDTQIVYKTLPGPPVHSVCLGGALGSHQDKVFVGFDSTVKGISKKGKQFFSFETNMAEPGRRMFIHGVELIITGRKSLNHYHDCADTNYYLCPDEINDVVCLYEKGGGAWSDRPFTMAIACCDSTIKVLEASSVAYEIQLEDVPNTLFLFMGDGGFTNQRVLYGTRCGRLGLVDIPRKDGRVVWEIGTTTDSAITCITCYPFTGHDRPDVLIGKEDGMVEIYQVDQEDALTLAAQFQSDETITGLGCGRVSQETMEEIIVCTYTGWLFSLCTVSLGSPSVAPTSSVNVKVQQLRTEIEELESKVSEERARYNEMTLKDGSGAAYIPHFQVLDQFEFSPTKGAYALTIELVLPIDYVIVQSSAPVRLIEVQKNSSVVCTLPQSEYNPWQLLASYRCQAKTTRIELLVKVNEGICGRLNVYVSPNIHPKAVQLQTFDIKPLSAHVRIHSIDQSRPMNTLQFTGSFSLAEAHSWLVMVLPGIPLKCPPTDDVIMHFQSAINGGTQLYVNYSRGSVTFRSDSMSTICVVRDKISQETTKKQIRVQIQCDLNEASIEHCLRLLHPKMTSLIGLQKRRMLAGALKELEMDNSDTSFLSEENKRILQDHDRIFREAELDSLEDSGILSIYESLLSDRARLHGKTAKARCAGLLALLRANYSLDEVIKFFKATSEEASLR